MADCIFAPQALGEAAGADRMIRAEFGRTAESRLNSGLEGFARHSSIRGAPAPRRPVEENGRAEYARGPAR